MKIINFEQLETAVNNLLIAQSKRQALEAVVNEKSAQLRQKAVTDIAGFDEECHRLENAIEIYATSHRDDPDFFPPGKKSIELRSGIIGFNDGKGKVEFRDGFDEEKVIALAAENNLAIVRDGEPSLDKDAVKRLTDQGAINDKLLRKIGLKIVQEESFYIKPTKVKLKK